MGKHFRCSLITRGKLGGSVTSFSINDVEAETKEEALEKAEKIIDADPFASPKRKLDGAKVKAYELNGDGS